MDLDSLKAKVGPLPVWGWGALLGALLVGYFYVSGKFPGDAATPATDSTGQADSGVDTSGGSVPINSGGLTPDTSNAAAPVASDPTNGDWLVQAVKAAVARGIPATTAQQALTRYLNGESLSAAQKAIVDVAVAALGVPPEGTPEPDVPAPAVAQSAVSYGTTMTYSFPKSVKVGQEFNVAVTVKARDSRAGTPTGTVVVSMSGGHTFKGGVSSNGSVNIQAKFPKNPGPLGYIRIVYTPSGKWQGFNSPSLPISVHK